MSQDRFLMYLESMIRSTLQRPWPRFATPMFDDEIAVEQPLNPPRFRNSPMRSRFLSKLLRRKRSRKSIKQTRNPLLRNPRRLPLDKEAQRSLPQNVEHLVVLCNHSLKLHRCRRRQQKLNRVPLVLLTTQIRKPYPTMARMILQRCQSLKRRTKPHVRQGESAKKS